MKIYIIYDIMMVEFFAFMTSNYRYNHMKARKSSATALQQGVFCHCRYSTDLPTGIAKKKIDSALVLIFWGTVSAMMDGAMVE